MFFFFFFFCGGEIAALTNQHADELALRSRWKGRIFDKSAFLRNTINTERCRQSEPPLKKSLFSKLAFIFFSYHDQFPVFLTSSHHCELCPQHLYRRTSSSFGDFALKHSLHLKAINHATITTRCVTVLLFISRFQVATLHLCLK